MPVSPGLSGHERARAKPCAVVACLGLLTLLLGLVGCSGPAKTTGLQKQPADRSPPTAARDDGPPSSPITRTGGNSGGVIAGLVLDNFNNRAYSDLWIGEPPDGKGASLYRKMETTRDGTFYIGNLERGRQYHLIARTKDGQFLQGGELTVTAPATSQVVILVSQDRIPPIPGGETGPQAPQMGDPVPLPSSGCRPRPSARSFRLFPVAVHRPDRSRPATRKTL